MKAMSSFGPMLPRFALSIVMVTISSVSPARAAEKEATVTEKVNDVRLLVPHLQPRPQQSGLHIGFCNAQQLRGLEAALPADKNRVGGHMGGRRLQPNALQRYRSEALRRDLVAHLEQLVTR